MLYIEKIHEFIFSKIADMIEMQIEKGILNPGDKMLSLREVCKIYSVSQSTAIRAYSVLTQKELIETKPQKGYYVSFRKRRPSLPKISRPEMVAGVEEIDDVIAEVYDNVSNINMTMLSLIVIDEKMLPIARLNKGVIESIRKMNHSGTEYESVQGNTKLRQQIARKSSPLQSTIEEQDIITTSGCLNALYCCLSALTQRGDTIAVESPAFFGTLQLAKNMGLNVIELVADACTGIDLDYLKNVLDKQKLKALVLITNFNNPLGSCMPNESKRLLVRMLEHYNIPLIEDDIFADQYFGSQRPESCKSYDESGLVLWCGSVSKTLAPGYRVGWVAPGKFKEEILKVKRYTTTSLTSITQEVIANFLANGRYEDHLRKLRSTLKLNSLRMIQAVQEYFPEHTRVSRPQGGAVLWLELDKQIDTMELYRNALKHGISIAPGRMFTLQKKYNNCLRLNYGLEWTTELSGKLKILGHLVK